MPLINWTGGELNIYMKDVELVTTISTPSGGAVGTGYKNMKISSNKYKKRF